MTDQWGFEFTNQHGGTLFTVVPISRKEYRDKSPTKAAVKVERSPLFFRCWFITLTDDWGKEYTLQTEDSDMVSKIVSQF